MHTCLAASAGGVFCATRAGGVAYLVATGGDGADTCVAPRGRVLAYACTDAAPALALLADGDVWLHSRDAGDSSDSEDSAGGGASLRAVHPELVASAVQCGKRSCFVLSGDEVLVSGANDFGELGLGSYTQQVRGTCRLLAVAVARVPRGRAPTQQHADSVHIVACWQLLLHACLAVAS